MNAADTALLQGKFQVAIDNYMQYLNFGSKNERYKTWDDLGYAYLRQGRINEAMPYLKKAKDAMKNNFDNHLYLAAGYLQRGEFSESLKLLHVIEENVYFESSWIDASADKIRKNEEGARLSEYETDRLKYEKGIYVDFTSSFPSHAVVYIDAFDPKNQGTSHFLKGLCYRGLQEDKNAEICFNRALKTGYFAPAVRHQLNELKFPNTEEIPTAPGQMTKFPLQIHHRLKNHSNNLLWYQHQRFFEELKSGEIQQSLKTLEEGLDINSRSFVINHNLAMLYFDLENYNKAAYYCARAIWFRSNYSGSYDLMGNICFRQKRYKDALVEFQYFLDLEKDNPNAYLNLGSAHYMLDDFERAVACWEKAIDLDKKTLTKTQGKVSADSEMSFALVVKKKSISYLAFESLGNYYFDRQFYEKAIDSLHKAISLKPQEPGPFLTLGKAYLEQENPSLEDIREASKHLKTYLFLGGKEEKKAQDLLARINKKAPLVNK
ncbi:MAG: tetratricopeptide repeat protein [Candidatus Aminicenantes bacterium]|nr:tetratricopeptide repeat protein [Candidatus Aminicenantes bacterium]